MTAPSACCRWAAPRTSSTARSCSGGSRAPATGWSPTRSRPTSSSSTPAPSSTGRSRSRWTPSSRWRARRKPAGRSGWWSPAASPSATTRSCAGRSRRSTPRSGPARWRRSCGPSAGKPPRWRRRRRACRPGSTTTPRRACSRRRRGSPTSRSARAATTPAPSASSRRCGAGTAAAGSRTSWRRRRALAARGVREVVLVAQDSTRYGLDHGVRDGLAYLLRRLGRVDGLRWIRVMYAYPSTLTRPDPRRDGLGGEGRQVRGHPAAARERGRAQAHEAAHRARQPPRHGAADPRARERGGHPHVLHRRLPGGDRGGLRAAAGVRSVPPSSTTSASSPSPTRRGRRPSTCPGAFRRG